MRVRVPGGRGRGLGLGLGGARRGRALAADVLAVGRPQQDALARGVQGAAVVGDGQVAPLAALGVGRPVGGLAVGVVEDQVGVGLVGQRGADVLAALVELVVFEGKGGLVWRE